MSAQTVLNGNNDIFSGNSSTGLDDLTGSIDVNSQTDGNQQTGNAASQGAVSTQTVQATRATQGAASRATAAGRIGSANNANGNVRSNVAVAPVQSGTGQNIETDPFGASGFRLGSFDATASLEQAIGYSDNVSGIVDGEGGAFSQTDANLSLTSDWSLHQLQTNFSGSYFKPFDSNEVDQPNFFTDTTLRLDLTDGYTFTARGFYNLTTQNFTSSTLAPGAIDTPSIQTYGGSLELQRTDRKLQLTLRGSLDRNTFEDAQLGGGLIQTQSDRDSNLYQLTARVGYETSPAFTPFIEGVYGLREFDESVDRNGNQRDSNIYELRGGVEIDLGEKLQGEFSVGYVGEEFDDPLLGTLEGFTVNGQLDWSPERDSLFTLSVGSQLNDSIVANENGSIIYTTRLDYQRQITSRWSMDAFADYELETNIENDTTLGFGVGVQYWVNRFSAITADVEHEMFTTDTPGSDIDETSARIGIRWQR